MSDTQTNNDLPLIISDSTRLIKLEDGTSFGFSVSDNRLDKGDGIWHYDSKWLYGKNSDDIDSPYISALNESAAQYFFRILQINYQPTTLINTIEGWKIGSVVNSEFQTSLEYSDRLSLNISNQDKIFNFILNIFLADTDSNPGSILVHENKKDISRIDSERCFGYDGSIYNKNVTNNLGTINPGSFSEEIKKMPIEEVINSSISSQIKTLKLEDFSTFLESIVNGLSTQWPDSRNELIAIKKHIYNCIEYRKNNIDMLVREQIKKY